MRSFGGIDPTAIVVDDDRVSTQVFIDVLRMIGVKVLASGFDGKDAVRLYKKYLPDIVFTDIMMPENDGFYALEEIRKLDPHAKVVAVTADFTNESAEISPRRSGWRSCGTSTKDARRRKVGGAPTVSRTWPSTTPRATDGPRSVP